MSQTQSTWACAARTVIAKVIRDNPGLEGAELKGKLSQAYPFGERAYHPYKVWLREVRSAVIGHAVSKGRAAKDVPGQGFLL